MESLRDQIEAIDDTSTCSIIIEEWNNMELFIRKVTTKQVEESIKGSKTNINKNGDVTIHSYDSQIKTIIMCVEDKEGNKVFKNTPEDINMLKGKCFTVFEKLLNKINEFNGFTKEAEAEKEKN